MSPTSITKLARRACGGDRRAFAVLWHELQRTVRAVIAAELPRAEVGDVAQDVAVAALSKLHTLRDDEGFPAWLCAIARNRARTVRMQLRRHAHSRDVELLADPRDDQPIADAGRALSRLQLREMLAVIAELPPAYRAPLQLSCVAGLSGPEIAARLGRTPGSIRVTLCRGRKLLRERMAARGGRGGRTTAADADRP